MSPKEDTVSADGFCPKKAASVSAESYISSVLSTKSPIRIFGYGSLCWNPGSPDKTLAKSHLGVTSSLGRVLGWRRCWCQESADHRGTEQFPGFVCTLLNDSEIAEISKTHMNNLGKEVDSLDSVKDISVNDEVSVTKGLIFTVPYHLVEDCLDELDFRESGGYRRDVIDVIEESNGETVKALLYRGTPQNPNFSPRALFDPIFAAARIAVSIGASGRNDEYLYNLDNFLAKIKDTSPKTSLGNERSETRERGDITVELASLTRDFQENYHVYFLNGSGSNQFDQLLLNYACKRGNAANLIRDEAHDLKDIILVTRKRKKSDKHNLPPKVRNLFAGGGHSALLTRDGDLYLWGSSEQGQLGHSPALPLSNFLPVISPLDLEVDAAALGHSHTLIIEKVTGSMFCFGENRRGQVTSVPMDPEFQMTPFKIEINEKVIDIACGLYHSAAITSSGALLTFGCNRFNQCVPNANHDGSSLIGKWSPDDGSKLVKVSCGQRHTLALDEHGRIWGLGSNKYGQLGRTNDECKEPSLISGYLGQKGSGCIDVDSGWSHNIALVQNLESENVIYGWGRNDKSQLGINCDKTSFHQPVLLKKVQSTNITKISCGAESIMLHDDNGGIYGSGWNEHGNLSTGHSINVRGIQKMSGEVRSSTPILDDANNRDICLAAGGAHFLVMTR